MTAVRRAFAWAPRTGIPKPGQLAKITEMVRAVSELGLETCATLGMLTRDQANTLRDAGLDYYNHNLDTSEAFYPQVISTRTYADRLDTLKTVRDAGLKVCCGGIIGLGEADQDRIELLHTLATLPEHPESVPVNQLVQVAGTTLAGQAAVDPLTFVRVIAVARILMPKSRVRLSAGRADMSDELQALCFFAGANSIFYGEQLLTTPNPATDRDLDAAGPARPQARGKPPDHCQSHDRDRYPGQRECCRRLNPRAPPGTNRRRSTGGRCAARSRALPRATTRRMCCKPRCGTGCSTACSGSSWSPGASSTWAPAPARRSPPSPPAFRQRK